MTEQSIKEILINNIGLDAYNQLRKDHLAILDESIESILNGSCIINNKPPSSDEEIFVCLSCYFHTALAAHSGMLSAKTFYGNALPSQDIVLSYRGQTFLYLKKYLSDQPDE